MSSRNVKHQAALRTGKKQFIAEWKASRGCAWCGEKDPVVLDLDHIDPASKDPRLKSRLGKGKQWSFDCLSWADLHIELEKCQVLCANDHRRKTLAERGVK